MPVSVIRAWLVWAAVLGRQWIGAHAHLIEHPKSAWRLDALRVDLDPGVTITLNATAFTRQRQVVEVSWAGLQNPTARDLIAVYAPPNVNPWRTLPIQFFSCSEADKGHLTQGAGTARVKLINVRNAFKFVVVRGGVVYPHIVAESAVLPNRIRALPSGGHLALHADERSVIAQWVSSSPYPQTLEWGLAPDTSVPATTAKPTYRFIAASSSETYRATDMCGAPANASGWMHPGHMHSAMMPGRTLEPGRRYVYRFGADGYVGWSSQFSFRAPVGPGVTPAPAPSLRNSDMSDTDQSLEGGLGVAATERSPRRALQAQAVAAQPAANHALRSEAGSQLRLEQAQHGGGEVPFTFLAFNDVCQTSPLLFNNPGRGGLHFADHYGENSTWLAGRLLEEKDAQLALLVGDLAYAMGYSADWDVWGDEFQDAFTQWPMAVGTGNHERDWPGTGDAFNNTAYDSGGECNVPFMHRWYTPANALGDPFTSYYSFRQGPVAFLILDSESPSGPNTPQGRFVVAALARVDRRVTPWVVVTMHRMMAAPATWRAPYVGDMDVMERLQADYEELFRQHQVDVVISGHEHAYARTCPLYRDKCTSAGTSRTTAAASPTTACPTPLVNTGKPHGNISHIFSAGSGGPVYVLAGHAGAGFTWGFPDPLGPWVEAAAQGVNGYLRWRATSTSLRMEAVAAKEGCVMDWLHLSR